MAGWRKLPGLTRPRVKCRGLGEGAGTNEKESSDMKVSSLVAWKGISDSRPKGTEQAKKYAELWQWEERASL